MSRRDDAVSAVAWALLGGVIVVASWRLDRLENLGINAWSVPGLTPGVIGALIVVLALVLALQSRATPGDTAPADDAGEDAETAPPSMRRSVVAAALCVAFAGLSLGHGLPFVVEAAAFVFTFITLFSLPAWRAEGRLARGLSMAFAVAVTSAAAIAWLFESVFLVRLP